MYQLSDEERDAVQREKMKQLLRQLPAVMVAALYDLDAGKAPRWIMAALEQIAWAMRQTFEKDDREDRLNTIRLNLCLEDPCFDEASRRRLGEAQKSGSDAA